MLFFRNKIAPELGIYAVDLGHKTDKEQKHLNFTNAARCIRRSFFKPQSRPSQQLLQTAKSKLGIIDKSSKLIQFGDTTQLNDPVMRKLKQNHLNLMKADDPTYKNVVRSVLAKNSTLVLFDKTIPRTCCNPVQSIIAINPNSLTTNGDRIRALIFEMVNLSRKGPRISQIATQVKTNRLDRTSIDVMSDNQRTKCHAIDRLISNFSEASHIHDGLELDIIDTIENYEAGTEEIFRHIIVNSKHKNDLAPAWKAVQGLNAMLFAGENAADIPED